MKSFVLRAAVFGVIFWLFVTSVLAFPSFRYCNVTSMPGAPRVTLCSAFPDGVNPRVHPRTPMAIIAGAGSTSLILTALALGSLVLGRVLFFVIRGRDD